jgi:hypothetical protein
MMESNFAEGYNVLTGNVDMMNPSNQIYGEVHAGEAWLPARNKYFAGNEGKTNMPVALIVFGAKSHTDLHRALLLTPIIFTMTMLFDWHVITPNSGDPLVTFQIYHMEKEQLRGLRRGIKFRMRT